MRPPSWATLGLELHPDKTRVVDLRGGREGFDFLGCHFHARMSGRLWEQQRIVRYYLHRWPVTAVDETVPVSGSRRSPVGSRVGMELKDVIGCLEPVPAGMGQLLPHRQRRPTSSATLDRHVAWRLYRLLVKKRGRNLRAGQAARWTEAWFHDQGLHKLSRHHPLPEGGVTMSRRPSVSRVRENRTHGLKGGWGNGPATAPRP